MIDLFDSRPTLERAGKLTHRVRAQCRRSVGKILTKILSPNPQIPAKEQATMVTWQITDNKFDFSVTHSIAASKDAGVPGAGRYGSLSRICE